MKKFLLTVIGASLLLAACASTTPQPTKVAPATVVAAPNTNAPTAVAVAPTKATKPISLEFTPTDPKNVKLAAGKVQFVEFFAFW